MTRVPSAERNLAHPSQAYDGSGVPVGAAGSPWCGGSPTCHDARVTATETVGPDVVDDLGPAYASWGRRVVAALLDGPVLGAVAWFVGGNAIDVPSLQPVFDTGGPQAGLQPWATSPVLVAALGLMLVLQGLTGQTPGRRVLGIVVVRAPADGPVGGAPGVLRSCVRCVAHLLDAIAFIGYLRPIWHHERRTFADSLVGTAVVRRDPSTDGRGRALTVAAAVAVLVGLAFGGRVGESGGVTSGPERACTLSPQPADAPLQVREVALVRETEWNRTFRLWPWLDDERHAERRRLSLRVTWDSEHPVGERSLLVRTSTDGMWVEHDTPAADGTALLQVERAGEGPVDVEVLWLGRTLTTCTAEVPPRD